MANSSVRLRFASLTVQGKNPAKVNNEDYCGHFQGKYGDLFLLCDGMGGEAGGEIASRMAVESINEYFESHYIEEEESTTIAQSVEYAQYKIIEYTKLNPEMTGMGTTLVLLLIKENSYYFANVGDSRIYLRRGGALLQLTKDHSEVQRMVEQGLISREEAAIHPLRNIITRAIGSPSYRPDISGPHLLQEGDVFLLCSDGLTEYVKDEEILQQLSEEPQIATHNLVDLAIHRGGLDDITVQIVEVLISKPVVIQEEVPASHPNRFYPSLALILTIVVFLVALFLYTQSLKKIPESSKVAPVDTLKEETLKEEETIPPIIEKKEQREEKSVAVFTQLDEKAIDAKLGASAANAHFQEVFNKMSDKKTQAKNLKFFSQTRDNTVIYILPGQTIYLAYGILGTKAGYNMSQEQIEALLAIAIARSSGDSNLNTENWEQELFAPANTPLDEATWKKAQEIYSRYNKANASSLFNSTKRFGKFKTLIRTGKYSIAINKSH
ncbi:MAG TPA: protein phosphatase 2C domain-containing protein [Candidatus Syntrophosphaera thermopropionivorans]|nr:protein phosphatase 2C domain-containing protein [Candidatus Syntrophosphaera thermopropionivorans]